MKAASPPASEQSRSCRAPRDTAPHTCCVLTPKGQVNQGECLHFTLSLEIGTKKKGGKNPKCQPVELETKLRYRVLN